MKLELSLNIDLKYLKYEIRPKSGASIFKVNATLIIKYITNQLIAIS